MLKNDCFHVVPEWATDVFTMIMWFTHSIWRINEQTIEFEGQADIATEHEGFSVRLKLGYL